jgi:hypothetical protein
MNPNHQTHAIASDGSLRPPVVEADGAGSTSEEVKAFQPIYRKVKEDLIHRVLKGEWKPGGNASEREGTCCRVWL